MGKDFEGVQEVYERITDGFFAVNSDWEYTYVNKQGAELVGKSQEELLGKTAWEAFPELADSAFGEILRQAMNTQETKSIEEYYPVHDAWYNVRVYPAKEGISIYFQDVTSSKSHQIELERQNERLEEFVSVVSHDLRNPLNVAQGRIELGREECESDHLEAAARAVDRSITLVDELLTLARQGDRNIELKEVELSSLVEGCWQNVETASATLEVETRQTIQADPSRLQQLLENLMTNAVEHGDERVTVTISDCECGFYVADDGPGIPEDERDYIFDAGYSSKSEGTGFGLNIVRKVAESHGWDIEVGDSETGGARFDIQINGSVETLKV